jgi:hypothetical protein
MFSCVSCRGAACCAQRPTRLQTRDALQNAANPPDDWKAGSVLLFWAQHAAGLSKLSCGRCCHPLKASEFQTATAVSPRADLSCQQGSFFEPRSGVGIQPRVSEAEPWVTNPIDASPGGAKEHGWNSQFLERSFLRPFRACFPIRTLTQGSALRLHPGLNSCAASRLLNLASVLGVLPRR